ncbi:MULTISPECIES: tape measure protein [unclassified Pseudomonas]|uniref:tape measure protein n=1 Tax=unclassified Pseudomonas TaxID=196821 RepID=UPI00224B3C9A|nr:MULTISPECIES: tape measure protein [unclassified Pseudomonas]MCX2814916.1 tape measure protein [Pseudomonas sp. DCB_E]MCX9144202.1 tape measure protein [Pseudomonas sp. DCB_Q]
MAGQTLRSLIVSVSAETSAYQREMAKAGRMGQSYLRTITAGNRDAVSSWRSQEAAVRAQGTAMQSLTSSVSGYATAMAGALAVGNLVHQADNWNQVNARLKQASQSMEDFTVSQKSLFDMSQRTGTAFADNANLFSRSSASMREFGYSSSDVLAVTEALAMGLQLSGAGGAEASSVITQFSQALGQGVLRGEEFNAVNENGDRVIRALAAGMGVARKDLKAMADNGLITIDKLVPALISQLGTLNDEFGKIPPSVSSSVTTLNNAFQAWVGMADGATGSTKVLAGAITFVAENMDLLAASAMTLGAAYGGRKVLDFTKDLWDQVKAIRSAQSAEIGRTAAQLDAASMAVRRAAAETIAAESQVAATRFTDAHAAALSRLRLARLADAQAAAAQTAAQTANNAATSLASRAGGALLGVLGGPAGLALTAGAVAASYLLFSDNSEKARKATVDLKRPVEELHKEFAELGKEQARYKLDGVLQQQADAQVAAQKALREIRASAQANDKWGDTYGANPFQRDQAVTQFNRRIAGGQDIDSATQQLVAAIRPNEEMTKAINASAAAYGEAIKASGDYGDVANMLRGRLDDVAAAAAGANAGLKSMPGPDQKTVDGWNSYTKNLVERLQSVRDGGDLLGEINRRIEREGVDPGTAEGWRILATAIQGSEAAAKASEEAQQRAKKASEDIQRQAERLNDAYKQTLANLTQQVALFGETTELGRLRYDLAAGELSKLSEQNKLRLEGKAIELDALNARKAYDGLMSSLQTKEQALLATTRERMMVLETARRAGTLNSDQYRAGADAISKATVVEAPQFGGLDASVAGASGELIKIAEAKANLKKWHDEQLTLQAELREQILADQASTNEERLNAEQQYLDRVADITRQNNERLSAIQDSYKVAVVSTFSELSGQAADMVGKIAGEQSGAYKALFIAQKAFAVASIIMNAQIAAAKAPAELTVLGGIPVGAALLAAGYASAAMVAGMALAGFSSGGYTGDGGKFEPKGVVHGGEFVLRKEVVQLPGMRDYLEGLNKRGYASGGFVGTAAVPARPSFAMPEVSSIEGKQPNNIQMKADIHNYGNDQVSTRIDGNTLKVFIAAAEEHIAKGFATGTGKVSRASEAAYGTRRVPR